LYRKTAKIQQFKKIIMTQQGGKGAKKTCWFMQMFVVLEQIKRQNEQGDWHTSTKQTLSTAPIANVTNSDLCSHSKQMQVFLCLH